MIRHILRTIAHAIPFGMLVKLASNRVVAPLYHTVSPNAPWHVKHLYPIVSPSTFKNDLDLMLRHFAPIDLNQAIEISKGLKLRRSSKPPLLLTFDDGFREMATIVAPILKAKGVPAAIFVSPDFVGNRNLMFRCKQSVIVSTVEGNKMVQGSPTAFNLWGKDSKQTGNFAKKIFELKYSETHTIDSIAHELGIDWQAYLKEVKPYLNLDEVRTLAKSGITIGAHSMSHPHMNELSLEQQLDEVKRSISWVQENVPGQPRVFAFPFTNYGIDDAFYQSVRPHVDLLLGTAGLYPSAHSQLLHRIPMEVKGKSARSVLGGELIISSIKRVFGVVEGG